MSVIKNMQKLSSMEFYKNAIRIRQRTTDWMLRDFGTKKSRRSVKQVVKNIDPDDQKIIDDIFNKYGKRLNQEFQSEYPEWFISFEQKAIIEIIHELMMNITAANSIYATREFEFDMRRKYQNEAIACCYKLYQELQYVITTVYTDANSYIQLLDSIDTEIDLLKGWRQSDNRARKKLKEK